MEALYAAFFADPMYYVGVIFAAWGAWGVTLFIMGFAGGARHLFTYSESDSHMKHARERIVWGLLLSMTAFGGWELLRVAVGLAPLTYLWIVVVMLTPLWIPWVRGLLGGKKSGGH
jgi:hypothetical protein